VVIDTIPLQKDNTFFVQFDSLAPGMYTFKHDPEYQYVYFDKNDSIMVRLNSNNFDQKLLIKESFFDHANWVVVCEKL
jgi:hypothetical protein